MTSVAGSVVSREPKAPPAVSSRAWMIIFTDLVSLMLTFFVMLFAMTSVKPDRWEETVDSLSRTLSPERPAVSVPATSRFNISTTLRKRAVNLDYLAAVLTQTMADDPVLARARLVDGDDRLFVVLATDTLFERGGVALSTAAETALFTLGGVLRSLGNQVGVVGHAETDSEGETGVAEAWRLSLARSTAVANALKTAGYRHQIIAFGQARPLAAESREGTQASAFSRRIEIVILPTVGES